MISKRILIKKYSNRRLYNTSTSNYVTLDQIASIIKKGETIKVVDVETKEEVTSFILTQIILEEVKLKRTILPASLLHLLIQYGDNILSEFFEKYLQQIVENYIYQKTLFDKQFSKMLDLGINISDAAQQTITDINPFKSILDLFSISENKSKDSNKAGNKN